MGQANSQCRLESNTHTDTHTRKLQAVSRSDTGPYGRPLELLPLAEWGGMDAEMVGGWQEEAEGSGGRLKLISRPPQLSTVFGELRHAYMWLIEPGG